MISYLFKMVGLTALLVTLIIYATDKSDAAEMMAGAAPIQHTVL